MEVLEDIEQIKKLFWGLTYGMPRLAALFWTVPFLGSHTVPPIVKNAISLSILVAVYPIIAPSVPDESYGYLFIVFIMLKEAFIGFLIGFVFSVIFWAAQSAGSQMDRQRGAFGHLGMNPMSQVETTPMGSLLFLLTVTLFFISDGFLAMISSVIESYRIWPIATFVPLIDSDVVIFFAGLVDKILRLSLVIGASIFILNFLTDLIFAIMNRFAPEMNVFIVTMSIKSGVTLLMILLCIGHLLTYIRGEFLEGGQVINLLKVVAHE